MIYSNTHLRGAIINAFIDFHKYLSYLEIGINNGVNFREICAISKQAVDPHWKLYPKFDNIYTGTSDDFFKINNKKFDIIFIDGLHTEEQSKKDIKNALDVLANNGTILCHDISPQVPSQIAPETYDGVVYDKNCWKSWLYFRKTRSDILMTALSDGDLLGVIQKGRQDTLETNCEITFENYIINRKKWLNLMSIQEYGKELTNFKWQPLNYIWDKKK
jgi:hypothetical protein